MTLVRKPLVDNFRKEGEPKKVTMRVLPVGRVLYCSSGEKKHWKEKCGENGGKNCSGDCSLERIVKESRIKKLGGSLTRGGLRLGVATRLMLSSHSGNGGRPRKHLTFAWNKGKSFLPSDPRSSFQTKVKNSIKKTGISCLFLHCLSPD